MAKGIPVQDTDATIYEPTESHKSWRIVYVDRTTGRRKTTSGGSTREGAETRARVLTGEYVPGWGPGEEQPTVSEAVANWLAANRSDWSSRTYDQYYYFGKKLTDRYGDRLVKHISPADIGRIDLSAHSRGQQQKARSLVRGIFRHARAHISPERANELAKGIVLSGTAGGKRNPRVDTNDIPRSPLVAAFIITAYHTTQLGPLDDPRYTRMDPLTGAKTREEERNEAGERTGSATVSKKRRGEPAPDDLCFRNGLPPEEIEKHRRGIPKHYSNPEARRSAEAIELANRYRQAGLATTLGAGGGLRIGEVLGLRVRHFLSSEQIHRIYDTDWDRTRSGFRGVLDVSEQASQASRGAIWVSGTKGSTKSRTVHLPAFLPNWNSEEGGSTRGQIERILPRFADSSLPLWEATDTESIELWRHGFTPLAYLLWDRLWDDLWHHPAISKLPLNKRITEFQDLLLFPTRNRVRPGREKQPVQTDPSWNNPIRIVPGTGSYQSQANYAKFANPVFDYVADEFNSYPRHRTNRDGRRGWTHHGLRHWAVSTRIKAQVPLPVIAREMGHKDGAFTMERYGHVLDKGISPRGFEY